MPIPRYVPRLISYALSIGLLTLVGCASSKKPYTPPAAPLPVNLAEINDDNRFETRSWFREPIREWRSSYDDYAREDIANALQGLDPLLYKLLQVNPGPASPDKVILAVKTYDRQKKLQRDGHDSASASFTPRYGIITLMESASRGIEKSATDALPHELTHALVRKYRLREGGSLNGVTWEDIIRYAENKLRDPAFATLKSRLEAKVAAADLQQMRGIIYGNTEHLAQLREWYQGFSAVKDVLDPDGAQLVEAKYDVLMQRWDAVTTILDGRYSAAEREWQSARTAVDFTWLKHEYRSLNDLLLDIPGVAVSLDETRNAVREALFDAQELLMDKQEKRLVRMLERAKDNPYFTVLLSNAVHEEKQLKEDRQTLKEEREKWVTYHASCVSTTTDQLVRAQEVAQSNKDSTRDMLGDPEEVLARVVQSASMHYSGELKANRWPRNEEDWKFLEALGLRGIATRDRHFHYLVEQGENPNEIGELLRQGSEHTIDGVAYFFPIVGESFKGPIALEETVQMARSWEE